MNNSITGKVNGLIEEYKKDHCGEIPLYIIISPGEADLFIDEIRKSRNLDSKAVVTTYRSITIARYDAFLNGKVLLSNELPETGS
jgi:hypothetical protein